MEIETEKFTPIFKEKGEEQFYFENDNWIKCDEEKIISLWHGWTVMSGAKMTTDSDGFTVFGILSKN